MRGIPNAVRAIAGGLAAGAAQALALCLASSALAAVTGVAVEVPGLFSATAALGGVVFTPDWGGVLMVLGAVVVGAVLAGKRSESS
jgi:hypothetical protein